MDVRSVFHGVILASITPRNTECTSIAGHSWQHNKACCHKTNWNSEINMTFNSVTLARTI